MTLESPDREIFYAQTRTTEFVTGLMAGLSYGDAHVDAGGSNVKIIFDALYNNVLGDPSVVATDKALNASHDELGRTALHIGIQVGIEDALSTIRMMKRERQTV